MVSAAHPARRTTASRLKARSIVGSIGRAERSRSHQVLVDTRVLQKEIAALISQLGRTYSATDELVYKVRQAALARCGSVGQHGLLTGDRRRRHKDEPRPRAQDAKKDEFGKRSYKLLVSIHDVRRCRSRPRATSRGAVLPGWSGRVDRWFAVVVARLGLRQTDDCRRGNRRPKEHDPRL